MLVTRALLINANTNNKLPGMKKCACLQYYIKYRSSLQNLERKNKAGKVSESWNHSF